MVPPSVNGAVNGDANGTHEPKMLSLEIEVADDEEEHQSLLREASDGIPNGSNNKNLFLGRNAQGLRRRQWGTADGIGYAAKGAGTGSSIIQGFLRSDLLSHAVYHLRNALVLVVLAFFVLLVLEWEGGVLRSENMDDEAVSSPHTWKLGGKFNRNHDLEPYKKRTPLSAEEEAGLEDEILDEATERVGTWDIVMENILNEQAHYLHDPKQSPFSSNLYNADDNELDQRQRRFNTRMEKIIDEFGVWNNPDYEDAIADDDDFFEQYYYRDVPAQDFRDDGWQNDRDYIGRFLDEAQSLVEATKEGIMQEYNHPNPDDDEKNLFGVIIGDQHDFINGTAHHSETGTRLQGVAYLPERAWKGLVRKLLHAMVTHDHFYVVVVGGDETYKANNFAKTQVMQFNYIMEPIFHKLGMTLISRNMGMSASTAVSALGGADIFGETDILWHVERIEDEEKPGEFDLLQKQAIMSGERVPIIFSPDWKELMDASKGKAWVGNIQPGVDFCQQTTMGVLPDAPACHNVHCDTEAWENRQCYVYDSVCWEIRSDWNPDEQSDDVGDQDADYPGHRRHQLEGRKMTLLLLHAMNAAIEEWRSNLEDDRSPLPLSTDLWHVGGFYEDIRGSVMSLERTPGEVAGIPACEKLLKEIDPRICHVPMHAYTEWTPRVRPGLSGLVSIINNMVVGADDEEELYDGPDILPLTWMVPDEELDVHMIAIAANVTPSYDDDLFGGMYLDDDWVADDWLEGLDDGGERRLRGEHTTEKTDERKLKKTKKNGKNSGGKTGGGKEPAITDPTTDEAATDEVTTDEATEEEANMDETMADQTKKGKAKGGKGNAKKANPDQGTKEATTVDGNDKANTDEGSADKTKKGDAKTGNAKKANTNQPTKNGDAKAGKAWKDKTKTDEAEVNADSDKRKGKKKEKKKEKKKDSGKQQNNDQNQKSNVATQGEDQQTEEAATEQPEDKEAATEQPEDNSSQIEGTNDSSESNKAGAQPEDKNSQTSEKEEAQGSNNKNNAKGKAKNKGKGKGRGKKNNKNNNKKNSANAPKPTEPPRQIYKGDRLEIAEGSGWQLQDAPVGFCDGSAQSTCNRHIDNMCLLANHNHYQGYVVGSSKNNWLTMRVPDVKHGIILARMSFEASDGSSTIPSDLLFDYAINGIVTTVQGSELPNFAREVVSGLTVYPLVNGRDAVVDGEDFGVNFDVAIRLRSFVDPNFVVKLSHIYYA